jgi:hypothetical protein
LALLETIVYLISAVLLFPAFGGGVWLIESAIRQKTNLGQSIRGGTAAKVIAGTIWLGWFFCIIVASSSLGSFIVFTVGIFVWEGIGLYGAYQWFKLQEVLTVPGLKVR